MERRGVRLWRSVCVATSTALVLLAAPAGAAWKAPVSATNATAAEGATAVVTVKRTKARTALAMRFAT